MATASLTIPSPKRIELNLEYFFASTRVRTATVSVAHKTEARSRHSESNNYYSKGKKYSFA